jgi:hypothetical protein
LALDLGRIALRYFEFRCYANRREVGHGASLRTVEVALERESPYRKDAEGVDSFSPFAAALPNVNRVANGFRSAQRPPIYE